MLDEYAGEAGTFINDPVTGTRVPIEAYQAAQDAEKTAQAQIDAPPKAQAKKTQTEGISDASIK